MELRARIEVLKVACTRPSLYMSMFVKLDFLKVRILPKHFALIALQSTVLPEVLVPATRTSQAIM